MKRVCARLRRAPCPAVSCCRCPPWYIVTAFVLLCVSLPFTLATLAPWFTVELEMKLPSGGGTTRRTCVFKFALAHTHRVVKVFHQTKRSAAVSICFVSHNKQTNTKYYSTDLTCVKNQNHRAFYHRMYVRAYLSADARFLKPFFKTLLMRMRNA